MFEWLLSNIRVILREKSDMFFLLVFPILMVFILGNMLADLDNPDNRIGDIDVAYYAEEADAAESAAVSEFVALLSENEKVEIEEAASAKAAKDAVEAGDADAALIFKTPLEIAVAEGKNIYKNRAAMLIAQSFAREYAAYAAIWKTAPEAFGQIAEDGHHDAAELVADKDLGVERSMMDYYAVTMIIMIVFMGGGISGATSIFIMRQNGSLRRMTVSTRSRARIFLESVFGVMPQSIMQTLIVMIPSALLLGAHYAKHWYENLLLFAFFIVLGIAVAAVFMLIGFVVRVNPYVPLLALLWALLFVSGTFSKEVVIEGFSEYLPMNIAQQAVFDLTLFGRPEPLFLVMGVCGAVIALSCVAGSALLKRKEIVF